MSGGNASPLAALAIGRIASSGSRRAAPRVPLAWLRLGVWSPRMAMAPPFSERGDVARVTASETASCRRSGSFGDRERRGRVVPRSACAGDVRVAEGEHARGVVGPDPDVQSPDAELVLGLESLTEERGRLRPAVPIGKHELDAHQAGSA